MVGETIMVRKIWDGPVRLFHWSLVGLLAFSWWSAETHHMDWHQYSGLAICALVVFRLLWGLFGSNTARFAEFVRGPRAIWAYLRPPVPGGQEPIGHNPVGAWSVILLLAILIVQVLSGLFAVDVDGIESGPMSYLVDFDQGRWAAEIHGLSFNVLLALSALHVLAILYYLIFRRRDLIRPMITGKGPATAGPRTQVLVRAPFWRLAVTVAAAGIFGYAVALGFRF